MHFIHENGFEFYLEPDLTDLVQMDEIEFKMNYDSNVGEKVPVNRVSDINAALLTIHFYLAEKYVAPFAESYEILHRTIWEGISFQTEKWHHDANDYSDLFFLLFFNNLISSGAFWYKNHLGKFRVPIKKGLLIAVNNSHNDIWQHKAEETTERRVVANFRFNVKWKKLN